MKMINRILALACALAIAVAGSYGVQMTNIVPTSHGIARKELSSGWNIGATNNVPTGMVSVVNGYMFGTTNGSSTNLDLLCAGGGTNQVAIIGGLVVGVSSITNASSPVETPTEWWAMEESPTNHTGLIAGSTIEEVSSGGYKTIRASGIASYSAYFYTNIAGNDLAMYWAADFTNAANQSVSFSYWANWDGYYVGGDGWTVPFRLTLRMRNASHVDQLEFSENYDNTPGGDLEKMVNFYNASDYAGYYNPDYTPATNAWVHKVFVYNGSSGLFSYYENAVQLFVSTNALYCGETTETYINFSRNTYDNPGKVDEIGLWLGHALTTNEINTIYNSGAGRTYPF